MPESRRVARRRSTTVREAEVRGAPKVRDVRSRDRVVVVLGMHRSGTSALARGLQVLGVDLGQQLIGPIPGNNEKGFWEDSDINRFNDHLLHKLGSAWDRVAAVDESTLLADNLHDEREAAGALLRSRLRPGIVFAFKDPRTAVLLPFWQQVFRALRLDADYVVAVRNPAEVVQSLLRRDGMDEVKAVMLWLAYSVSAVRYTQGLERVFVAYGNLMENAGKELRRVSLALRLPPPENNPTELAAYTNDFLSPELRHHVAAAGELSDSTSTSPVVDELYQILAQAATDRTAVLGVPWQECWAKIEARFADMLPLLRRLDRLETQPNATPDARSSSEMDGGDTFVPLRKFSSLGNSLDPEFGRLVHRWSIDSFRDGSMLQEGAEHLVISGWVWPTSTAEVQLATRQGGVTRSYPMNVERPDVVQSLQVECDNGSASSVCGFKYTVLGGKDFEIGFEIDGWLFWLYRAASSR